MIMLEYPAHRVHITFGVGQYPSCDIINVFLPRVICNFRATVDCPLPELPRMIMRHESLSML